MEFPEPWHSTPLAQWPAIPRLARQMRRERVNLGWDWNHRPDRHGRHASELRRMVLEAVREARRQGQAARRAAKGDSAAAQSGVEPS
jgi:hypothetical protein